MPIDELSSMPVRFTAGDTVTVRVNAASFPASSWALTVYFSGPEQFSKAATADGDAFLVSLVPSDTESRKPGKYMWSMRATQGSTLADTFRTGVVSIAPNPAKAPVQSSTAKLVAALEAAILKLSTKTAASVSVNGKSYNLLDIEKLQKALRNAKADLAAEQDAEAALSGAGNSRLIKIRFTQP